LRPDVHRERGRVEALYWPDAVDSVGEVPPERLAPGSDRRNQSDPCDNNSSHRNYAVAVAPGPIWRCTTSTVSLTFLIVANSSSGMLILYFLSTATMTSMAINESTPSSSANSAVSVISS